MDVLLSVYSLARIFSCEVNITDFVSFCQLLFRRRYATLHVISVGKNRRLIYASSYSSHRRSARTAARLFRSFRLRRRCAGRASCTAAPAADAVTAADAPSDAEADAVSPGESDKSSPAALDEGGEYTSAEDVALYLHLYAHLPQNFITKKDARALGWNGGGLDDYADGKCIGGDRFGNYEGLLPDAPGRSTMSVISTHCTPSRAWAKRIVYSNDGLIYYTEDHYESFILSLWRRMMFF